MYQCQIISCNKGTTLVGNADNRRGYVSVGAGEKWKVSVPSHQFCCEPKTAPLKIS